jgi:hypothetical protein
MTRQTERADGDRWIAFILGVIAASLLLWMIS